MPTTRNGQHVAADQVFDYACISAGLLDDGREMLPRMARLLEFALEREAPPVLVDDASASASGGALESDKDATYSFKPPADKA